MMRHRPVTHRIMRHFTMYPTPRHSMRILSARTAIAATTLLYATACSSGLLDVSDPTLIQDSDIANAAGANAQRLSVASMVNQSVGNVFADAALFSDERMYDQAFPSTNNNTNGSNLDTHDMVHYELSASLNGRDPHLAPLTSILVSASIALVGVRAHADTAMRGDFIAQIYALRGLAIIQMAEDLCPGFPINDVRDGASYFSEPYSTDAALTYAIATLDTALANGRDSVRFLNLARVLKGRALVDLGQYAQAQAVVASVPTDFSYSTDNGAGNLFGTNFPGAPRAVGNLDGGTGLPFAAARDPRVVTVYKRQRFHLTSDPVSDSLRDQTQYTSYQAPIVFASGIEARLIEAEAALNANDPTTWLNTLNGLRATAISPAMPALADPGPATRLDTLFKERAFWMYLTGHRLGDMRRLVRRYARADTTVFPHGVHPIGVPYGTAKSIPFIKSVAAQFNPHITAGCGPE